MISPLKQSTYMHLKGLLTKFQKMALFIILWLTVSKILGFEIEDFFEFHWVNIFFVILIAKISRVVDQTPINHISVLRTFRFTYVNCFNRLRFLAEVSTKVQKIYFFGQIKVRTQEGNIETRQMTQFFHLLFPL